MQDEYKVRCVDILTGATNSAECKLCPAGSYGSGSGALTWIGASRGREVYFSLQCWEPWWCVYHSIVGYNLANSGFHALSCKSFSFTCLALQCRYSVWIPRANRISFSSNDRHDCVWLEQVFTRNNRDLFGLDSVKSKVLVRSLMILSAPMEPKSSPTIETPQGPYCSAECGRPMI